MHVEVRGQLMLSLSQVDSRAQTQSLVGLGSEPLPTVISVVSAWASSTFELLLFSCEHECTSWLALQFLLLLYLELECPVL